MRAENGGEAARSEFKMVSNLDQKLKFCAFYDRKTRRCVLDGTAWCAFPTAHYCESAMSQLTKEDRIPSVIREILFNH